MTSDAPEYLTDPSTPLSPLPVYPPEPSNIPVLQNQNDPLFNMTSTHVGFLHDEALSIAMTKAMVSPKRDQILEATVDNEDITSSSDPYDEEEGLTESDPNQQSKTNADADAGADADDDYAMTFDSEGDETASKLVPTSMVMDHIPVAPEIPQLQDATSPISATASSEDGMSHALPQEVPQEVPQESLQEPDMPPTPSPAHLANPIQTEGILPANTIENLTQSVPETLTATNALSTEISQPESHDYAGSASGEIDIQQLLDNITASAEANGSNDPSATPAPASPSYINFAAPPPGVLPAHASLPPRPPHMQNQVTQPPYISPDSMRNFQAGSISIPPSFRNLGPPGAPVSAGAPGTSTDFRNALPPPPPASFNTAPGSVPPPSLSQVQYPPPQIAIGQDRAPILIEPADGDHGEVQWGPNVQKVYEDFLNDERMYVAEGTWDKFPLGSRLFVGNLSTEKVTKRDLFYAFYKYGRLAQVSIKQAYGFVQFHDATACHRALQQEQGQEIRGRKMHLEISKPQKNTRQANKAAVATTTRRSRSPEYSRGVDRGVVRDSATSRGYDRYDARNPISPRESDFRGQIRGRDDYRPGRSPSPPRAVFRGRDEYTSSRGRDSYDGRDRHRSRSRSPYDRRDSGRYRVRSPSPRGIDLGGDDLLIPRREPRNVPDVQIILMDELDRGFVGWVEGELRGKGIKTEVLFLSPRLPLAAVIQRQILEGVLAVTQLNLRAQDASKIPLQVFDRSAGANNVRFDEYTDLEPRIAAELVVREKQKQAPMTMPTYGQPQYSSSQTFQPPVPAVQPANLANLVGNLDNASLQQLLGSLNASGQQPQHSVRASPSIDLAGIFGGLAQQPQQQSYNSVPSNGYGAAAAAPPPPNLASLLGNSNSVQAQPSAQQVQNIMAQLARFRQ